MKTLINYIKENDEVLYAVDEIKWLSKKDIDNLVQLAKKNIKKRVRICTHNDLNNILHEMFIIHLKDCYVRPHYHLKKSESLHVIKGELDMVLFKDNGKIKKVIEMGSFGSGKQFYQRIDSSIPHTLIIKSDYLVFHEVTNGPFNKRDTIFPEWSPETNVGHSNKFLEKVNELKH